VLGIPFTELGPLLFAAGILVKTTIRDFGFLRMRFKTSVLCIAKGRHLKWEWNEKGLCAD
jgi:hypothetical protein